MSLKDFFTAGANGETPPLDFKSSNVESSGKYKRKVLLHAHHAETGDKLGTLSYWPPNKEGGKMAVDFLNVHPKHQRKGVASSLMDEMKKRHPHSEIDHGKRTPQGTAWWSGYSGSGNDHDSDSTPDGDSDDCGTSTTAAYQHSHEWLPEGRYWGPSSAENDQRLFDGDHLKPAVRKDLLNIYGSFCSFHRYLGWGNWSRIYFAGSQASKFLTNGIGNNDFDVLLGIDYEIFKHWNPSFVDSTDEEISKRITDEMHAELNDSEYHPPIEGNDRFDLTWYSNANSWNVHNINPYAAYELVSDSWVVKPWETPQDWSPQSLPESFLEVSEAEENLINVVSELPPLERQQVAEQIYDMIHEGRKEAFHEHSKGLFSFQNVLEKFLDQAPSHPLARLIEMKNAKPVEDANSWRPPMGQLVKTAIAEADKGVMIAFVPPMELRQELSQYQGESPADMHITLAYMGKLDELTPKQRRYLPSLVKNWAVAQSQLMAKVSGVGTFANPDNHALIAIPDIPHANSLRESLVAYLEAHGYPIYHNHGWVAHLTLAYSKHHFRFLPKAPTHLSWSIDSVSVFMAGRETVVPFGPRE